MKNRKRDKVFSIRLTEKENNFVNEIFNKYDCSKTETFLRSMILLKEIEKYYGKRNTDKKVK